MAGMSADRILAVKLVTDVSGMAKDMKKTEKGVKRLGGKLKDLGKGAANWGKAFAGAAIITGIEAVSNAMGDAIAGAQEGQRQFASLEDTARRLGLPLEKVAAGFDAISDSALKAGVDDTPVQRMFNALIAKGDPTWRAVRKVNSALDVSAKLGIPVEAAGKLIQKAMNGNATALERLGLPKSAKGTEALRLIEERFGGAAEAAAEASPMATALNSIGEALETIAAVAILPFLTGFAHLMKDTVAPAVTELADAIGKVDFSTIDWGQALQDVLASAFRAVTDAVSSGQVPEIGLLALALAGAVAAIDVFANALGAMFRAPGWLAKKGLGVAVNVLGGIIGGALSVAMSAVELFAPELAGMLLKLPKTAGVKATMTRAGVGIAGGIVAGMVGFLTGAVAIGKVADALFKLTHPDLNNWPERAGLPDPGFRWPWSPGGFFDQFFAQGTPSAPRGWGIVGEEGPELVRFRGGEQVLSNRASAAALAGAGSGGSINVTIQAGIGDPVEIGRKVDQVLRQYRRRAGLAYT